MQILIGICRSKKQHRILVNIELAKQKESVHRIAILRPTFLAIFFFHLRFVFSDVGI